MIIDLTYSCKMGCSHCMSDCKPEGKNMSIQVLKDSLDFLKKYQIPTWYFSGGEIFEHRRTKLVFLLKDHSVPTGNSNTDML